MPAVIVGIHGERQRIDHLSVVIVRGVDGLRGAAGVDVNEGCVPPRPTRKTNGLPESGGKNVRERVLIANIAVNQIRNADGDPGRLDPDRNLIDNFRICGDILPEVTGQAA